MAVRTDENDDSLGKGWRSWGCASLFEWRLVTQMNEGGFVWMDACVRVAR